MIRGRAFGAVGLTSAALVSCTLLVDLDGLVQMTPAGPTDASPEVGSAEAGADSRTDAPLADPCAVSGLLYCTRFDDSRSLDAFRRTTDPTTRVEVLTSSFFSPPSAAAFTIDPSGNGSADATLALTVGTDVSRAVLRAKVRIDKREAVDGRLVAMRLGNSGTILLDHGGEIRESGAAKLGMAPALPDAQWVEFRLELDGTVVPPRVRVTVGNAALTEVSVGSGAWSPGEVTVVFGISETSTPSSGWLVRWDDVVIQRL